MRYSVESISPDTPELPAGWKHQPLSELVDGERGICYGIGQPDSHRAEGVPPAPSTQKFTNTITPMLKRISQIIQESRSLATLQDALLPKLLSGELRVAEVEEIVHNPERQIL